MKNNLTNATNQCEDFLKAEKKFRIDESIMHSEIEIIERLLNRSVEMKEVYEELVDLLDSSKYQKLIEVIINTAAFWNPAALKKSRDLRLEMIDLNVSISKLGSELAILLRKRTRLRNIGDFTSTNKVHIVDFIDMAGDKVSRYGYIKPKLELLKNQYDLKYWPELSTLLDVISSDAKKSEIFPADPLTEAGIKSQRPSRADFFRALFAAIEEQKEISNIIPKLFVISDKSLATIANCSLNLEDEELLDSEYVKRLRQRDRESA